MQIGKLALQHYVVMGGAGNVSGAAGAGASIVDRILHGAQNVRVLPHSQVIVAAPDSDFVGAVAGVARRIGECAGMALQIGEDPIAALGREIGDRFSEKSLVIHIRLLSRHARPT